MWTASERATNAGIPMVRRPTHSEPPRAERAAVLAPLPPDPAIALLRERTRSAALRAELHDLSEGKGPRATPGITEARDNLRVWRRERSLATDVPRGTSIGRRDRRRWKSRLEEAQIQCDRWEARHEQLVTPARAAIDEEIEALEQSVNRLESIRHTRQTRSLGAAERRVIALDRRLEPLDRVWGQELDIPEVDHGIEL